MLPGATSCFFDGSFYGNFTDGFNMCDISLNPYIILANDTTPPSSYYWFEGLGENYMSYYTVVKDVDLIEENITLTLQSNVSSDLIDTILEFNLTNSGNINNDTFISNLELLFMILLLQLWIEIVVILLRQITILLIT